MIWFALAVSLIANAVQAIRTADRESQIVLLASQLEALEDQP